MLKKEHGIELSTSSISRLLNKMGLSAQRPVYKAYNQDIVALLDVYLPRADRTKQAVIDSMNKRHAKRRAAIESARRSKALINEKQT